MGKTLIALLVVIIVVQPKSRYEVPRWEPLGPIELCVPVNKHKVDLQLLSQLEIETKASQMLALGDTLYPVYNNLDFLRQVSYLDSNGIRYECGKWIIQLISYGSGMPNIRAYVFYKVNDLYLYCGCACGGRLDYEGDRCDYCIEDNILTISYKEETVLSAMVLPEQIKEDGLLYENPLK